MRSLFGKIFNKIFSRFTITLVFILIQLYYFFVLVFKLAYYAKWISIGFTVVAVILALFIIWRDYNPAYKIGWILLICLLPIMGVPLYLLFGNKRPAKLLKRRIDPMEQIHLDDLKQEDDIRNIASPRLQRTCSYIAEKGPYPAWKNTRTKYYPVGDDMFEDMLKDLAKAEHFIFMEYFIFSRGWLWEKVFDILKEKAAAGLDVRIIYDDIGTMAKIPKHFEKLLKENNIKVMSFNKMRPILSLVYNNRDHRKITVIDGYIGYTGGANIADEYANKIVRFGHWKDSGVRMYGDAVWNLTVMFLNMWNSFVKTDVGYNIFKPHVWHPESFKTDGIVQPYSDTPLDDENLGENVYLEILNQAEDYVFIYTPYLIIDNEMQTALTLAAKRGVDVRLVTPGIPDKPLIYTLSRSYYEPLIKAGVRIYEYTPGFIHAKSFVSDDRIAVVGTINMDYRSLFLHFECGALLIENSAIEDIRNDCIETFQRSYEITAKDRKRFFFGRLLAAILRVFGPVL
ncbi:cardiolipin synthase [Aminicella lysinilytica]|uniref:cardiolipin synthase n=1 Tax=Aminicella lysinilytica TaxID=433323 RepID=UPI0026F14C32|nr:cardiolipin synthase [Aminicella lysinilytica]